MYGYAREKNSTHLESAHQAGSNDTHVAYIHGEKNVSPEQPLDEV